MPAKATPKSSTGAFYQKVDEAFYEQVKRENSGTLPANLTDAKGNPRKLSMSTADAAYRRKWLATAARMRNSRAISEKAVTSPCVPCAARAASARIARIRLPSKKAGEPIEIELSLPSIESPESQLRAGIEAYNKAMLVKVNASAAFFNGSQANKDTCALMSVNSVLWERTGRNTPPTPASGPLDRVQDWWAGMNIKPSTPAVEREMITVGHASDGYSWCSGTSDPSAVMDHAGLPSQNKWSPSLENIAGAVEDGKGVLVGYDTRPVWGGRWLKDPKPAGHAVRVTGVERAPDGSVAALYINDSGSGIAPQKVPAATFEKALNGFGGGLMTTTEDAPFTPVSDPRSTRIDINTTSNSNRFV